MLKNEIVLRPADGWSQYRSSFNNTKSTPDLRSAMSNHYAHSRAPAEAQRIQAYLDAMAIPPHKPIPTKALVEAVFAGEENQKWCQRNIRSIASYLAGYYMRGAPFQLYGRTCRSYLWHSPGEPEPELDPEALEVRINQLQATIDRMEGTLDEIKELVVGLSQGMIIT